MKKEALVAARAAYEIEYECIKEMLAYFDDEAFANAVELLKNAPRIGSSGCGHSGIICQHFAHLMCCIEQPAPQLSALEIEIGDVEKFADNVACQHYIITYGDNRAAIKDLCSILGIKVDLVCEK